MQQVFCEGGRTSTFTEPFIDKEMKSEDNSTICPMSLNKLVVKARLELFPPDSDTVCVTVCNVTLKHSENMTDSVTISNHTDSEVLYFHISLHFCIYAFIYLSSTYHFVL
jgi:hypothetical protein